MPEFTDKEFLEKKAEYVAENGYSITMPKFRDIVHIGLHKPITPAEKTLYYSNRKHEISKSRLIELGYQKERSRQKYKQYLASPIPNVISNITSVLTAMDNVQDAIISLAFLGRIALKFLPRIFMGALAWPIGLLWLIATVMSLLMGPSMCALNPMSCKRYMRMKLAMRAKSLKGASQTLKDRAGAMSKYEAARLKAGLRGYATSGGFMPSFSELIQFLQTTDAIYGVGVSIGPVFGMAYDLASGGVRWAAGQKVSFNNSPSDIEIYEKAGDEVNRYARYKRPTTKMTKSEFSSWKAKKVSEGTWGIKNKQQDAVHQAIRLHQTGYGIKRRTDWAEETALCGLADLAGQGIENILNWWDPVSQVEGLEHIEIEAYHEPSPLIEEMLREEGVDPEERIGWPSVNKRWATYEELQTSIAPVAADNIRYFSEACPDERQKAIGETSATAAGLQNIALMVGEQNIGIQFHAAMDIGEMLLDKGYAFPRTITQEQMNEFALWTQAHEDGNTRPDLREILGYAKNSLGFEFTTQIGAG